MLIPSQSPTFTTHGITGEQLLLLPERAILWPARAALLVADAHWGKVAAFRAAGMPLPPGTTGSDLDRLESLIARHQPRRLVLLGDLFHSRAARASATLAAIKSWRERHADIEMTLVRGNHDRHAGDPPEAFGITCHDEPLLDGPFAFRHYPVSTPGAYTLAGHLHPAALLNGGKQRLMLPCFWFGREVGVLPAFGSFTGSATIRPSLGDAVFVIAETEVVRVG